MVQYPCLSPMYVCMYVSHVLDRKLLERLMSPSPKSQVMFASAFSWIGDFFELLGFIFFKLWRVWWISLRLWAVAQRWLRVKQSGSLHYTKIGDACVPRHVCSTPSTSPSWTLDQPGTVKVGSGYTLTVPPTYGSQLRIPITVQI